MTSTPATVEATWVGPYGYQLANGTLLVPGETTVELPIGEVAQSENWEAAHGSKTAVESYVKQLEGADGLPDAEAEAKAEAERIAAEAEAKAQAEADAANSSTTKKKGDA